MRTIVLYGLAAVLSATALSAAEPLPRIEQLGWMAGSWQGRQGGVEMEESWTAPKGGSMLGVHRDVRQGRTVSFEFFRVAEDKDGIVYFASPGGRPATPFRLVEAGRERVVFANPEHDFPQRILYWKDGEGALHARIEGTQGGKPASEEWRWTKSAP